MVYWWRYASREIDTVLLYMFLAEPQIRFNLPLIIPDPFALLSHFYPSVSREEENPSPGFFEMALRSVCL
jgi:hypothetical protein